MNKEYPKAYPTIAQGLGLIGWYVLFTFGAVLLLMPFIGLNPNISSFQVLLIYILSMSFLSLFCIRRSGNLVVPIIGNLPTAHWMLFPLLIMAVLCSIFIVDPIISLIPMPEWAEEMLFSGLKKDLPTFLMIVIAAPIFEEFIFRGIVLEGFLKNYEPKKAIIMSALLFGVIHLNPWQFLGGFLIGLLLGWVYYRTRALLPCVFIHLLNNLIAYLGFYYLDEKASSVYELSPSIGLSIMVFLMALVLLYLIVKQLDRVMPQDIPIEIEENENA